MSNEFGFVSYNFIIYVERYVYLPTVVSYITPGL